MEPQIVDLGPLTLVGLDARFIAAMSPDANNMQVIPPLFGKFFARRGEIGPGLDACTYGACKGVPDAQRTRDDEMVYLVAARVAPGTPPPAGMTGWNLPAQTYAQFTHRGPIQKLGETIQHIYRVWLPQSGFARAEGAEIERYDERFGDGGENSALDYLIPIRKR